MVALTEKAQQYQTEWQTMMKLVRRAMHLLDPSQTITYISTKYQLQAPDVAEWYAQTDWLCQPQIQEDTLIDTQQTLMELGLIPSVLPSQELVAPFTRLTHDSLSQVMYDWRVESVYKKLASQGKGTGPLDLADLIALGHLDQYHYLGAQTSYEIAKRLDLSPHDSVLDIGSGVGGTSRVIAHTSGCKVLGIEIQDSLTELAVELTSRVGLEHLVRYQAGDFLQFEHEASFDYLLSLMVFLHIPNRPAVLQKCWELTKPGGKILIEDFVALQPRFTQAEQQALQEVVSAPMITNRQIYIQDLRHAGFTQIEIQDMSEAWKRWTQQRHADFIAEAEEQRAFFGPELYDHRAFFYQTIRDLFADGNLGGVRILAQRPDK